MSLSPDLDAMARAMFAYAFDEFSAVDRAEFAVIRSGRVDDWVRAVADMGLLSNDSVRTLAAAWRADPELLVDALLDGADEGTRRRLKVA